MKKTHSRSNLIGFCRGLMRLQHRNTGIFIVFFLLLLALLTTLFGLYLLQASYALGVQITVSKYSRHCEVIHVASVVGGQANTQHFVILVKSILGKTQNPIHLHVLTNRESHGILKKLFDTWELPAVKISLYEVERSLSRVDWIPNVHYSGIYGLLKLVIPDILPTTLERVVVLDTDLLFVSDIVELWSRFSFMAPQEFLGMTENLSGWYSQNVTGPKWPALGKGFNSGLILMNLEKIRDAQFATRWRDVAEENLRQTGKTFLADQDIFNSYLVKYSNALYVLPAEWNIQIGIKSIHPDNLLQRAKVYTIGQSGTFIQNSDKITLVTQISADRLSLLDSLLLSWNGTVSVALYGNDREINNVVSFLIAKFSERINIGLHGVYKNDNVYPINYLRNVALNASVTEFVFVVDGDFIVHQGLIEICRAQSLSEVFVIPAFQYEKVQYDALEPLNKTRLLKHVKEGSIIPFRLNVWPNGHKAINFSKWYNHSEKYQIDWEPNFEPYIIGRKSELPYFDQSFGGFGWNKVTYAFELTTRG